MFNLFGCCGGRRKGGAPQTEEDRAARAMAAERAEARQKQFEQSAVGRAAMKSVKDAKKPTVATPAGGATAQDWLS